MKSHKSPAFQFYPNDFVGSGKVGMMTPDEVGVYVLLLCLEWNDVGFSYDAKRLAKWCRTSPAKLSAAWRAVRECFVERDGRFFSPRLDAERAKQAEWREKSSKGGKKSAEAKGNGGSTTLQPPLQPNANTLFPSPTPVTTSTTALAPMAPSELPDVPPAPDVPPVRPSRAPARKPPVAGAPETESSLSRLPKATVDAAHDRWVTTIGGVDYGRLRKALLLVFNAQPLVYTGEQVARGIEAFHEAASSDGPKWRGKWTPEKFASEIHEWVKLGAIELVDEWGQPTERGRAAGIFA